jgi:hypothetical protein
MVLKLLPETFLNFIGGGHYADECGSTEHLSVCGFQLDVHGRFLVSGGGTDARSHWVLRPAIRDRTDEELWKFARAPGWRLDLYQLHISHRQCPLWVISGQTVAGQNPRLSALVQKRTNCCSAAIVRFVPIGDIARLV